MKNTIGQSYKAAVFFGGIAADIDPGMLDPNTGAFLDTHYMCISDKLRNVVSKMNGDKSFVAAVAKGDQQFTGAIWLNGYIVEFWRGSTVTAIYANGLKIAEHADLPSGHLDIDINMESSEMFLTDNVQAPLVLNLLDMISSVATTTYFADYDRTLYEVNSPVQLNQPVFMNLEDVGTGGGLLVGSYAYAMRYKRTNGDSTNWSPLCPYIPIPERYKTIYPPITIIAPSVRMQGAAPSLSAGRYGIRLRLRITNIAGFDYIEIKRYKNATGQPVSYTPSPEYIVLSTDADGGVVDIKSNPYSVVDFLDSGALQWAALDATDTASYSTVKKARTIRYVDRRIVLGGVEYESHILSDEDVFIQHASVSKIAFPILKNLGQEGYSTIYNQVYNKSHRLGERYGYAMKLYDNQGNNLFSIPLVKGAENFSNYMFPNRRDIIPAAERSFSPIAQTTSTVESISPTAANRTDVVYDLVANAMQAKSLPTKIRNIVNRPELGVPVAGAYIPMTPTGRDDGYVGTAGSGSGAIGGGGLDFSGLSYQHMDEIDGSGYNQGRYGNLKSSAGLSIGGVDVSKLPSWVRGFSIVRTPPAGRVVCQGIGMYSLTPQAVGSTSPSLVKSLNKLWFFSPEIDKTIGDKPTIFDDIKANPSAYKIQLVAPVGFFTDVYAAYGSTTTTQIDMISYAIMGSSNIHNMTPLDTSAQIGAGEGRTTFGRWRNVYPTYNQATMPSDLIFSLSYADEVTIDASYVKSSQSRTPMLNLTLGANVYSYTNINDPAGASQGRDFHEPWYIVNIIKEGNTIPNNNINSYNDIGHYIKLKSIVGAGNGESVQTFRLVDERIEDVLTTAATAAGYRYIWVDGKRWLGANSIAAGTITTYRTSLENTGSFTPSGGEQCFGLYYITYASDVVVDITFPYTMPISGESICPAVNEVVEVRYNNNSPISLFLGDVIVDDAVCAPVDCEMSSKTIVASAGFRLFAAMPFRTFSFQDLYRIPRDPMNGTDEGTIYSVSPSYTMGFVRQWAVNFCCESTINLPFVYRDFFPNRNYVMRPVIYPEKLDDETDLEYYTRVKLWAEEYQTDYGDEYLDWGRGGFHLPGGVNYDFQKGIHTKAYTKPKSGYVEVTSFPKRVHWSTESIPGYSLSKSFLPSNIYDLKNDRASQISILYDTYSSRGNNLYIITDRGAGMLLMNKQLVTDASGNALSIRSAEAGFVQGEVWLNNSIGCPREFWRGKSEGSIRLPNNVKSPVLIFPTWDDIIMFSNDHFMGISNNYKKAIITRLELTDLSGDFATKLYSAIDEAENNVWVCIGDTTYIFNGSINNWGGSIKNAYYNKAVFSPYLVGVNDRNALGFVYEDDTNRAVTISHKNPSMVTSVANPYVVFSVTPNITKLSRFVDVFITSTHKPYSVEIANNLDFTGAVTVSQANIKEYQPGLYNIQGIPRDTLSKRMICKTLFIKITFPNHLETYGIKVVEVGYINVIGS